MVKKENYTQENGGKLVLQAVSNEQQSLNI
jgi:hypothetical protein